MAAIELHENRMKAVVQDRYGLDALRLEDIALPLVGDGDVLVRVRAAGVNPLDWHYARGVPYVARMSMGMPGPKPRGGEWTSRGALNPSAKR